MDSQNISRPLNVVTRKSVGGDPAADSKRRKLANFLKEHGIIEDKSSGKLTITLQDGGIRSSMLELIDPV